MINVQLDRHGHVVGVWYKHTALPFTETEVNDLQADHLSILYKQRAMPVIVGIDIESQD